MSAVANDIEMIWQDPDAQFCLCVGAGVTSSFVGNWKKLLASLAKMRFLSKWNSTHDGNNPFNDFFRQHQKLDFFPSADVLEQGEYLLADDNDHSKFIGTDQELRWREQLFREQVNMIIRQNIRDYISSKCDGKKEDTEKSTSKEFCCASCKRCKHRKESMFESIPEYFVSIMKKDPLCKRRKALATLDSIVRLCFSGGVQHLIVYNFDTILENILSDKEVQKHYKVKKKVLIDVYSYGSYASQENNGCKYHFGVFPGNYDLSGTKEIHISTYHVHGIVEDSLPPVPLVFSEHSYIEYGELFFNWSNQILLDLITRYNLLTVGFSGTDSNFRLMTRSIKKASESPMFGISNKRTSIIITQAESVYRWHLREQAPDISEDIEDTLNLYYMEMVDLYYKNYFDITVWWAKDFDQLAHNLCQRLRATAGRFSSGSP